MSKERRAGVLMPIASLPAGHGIGDFGPAAKAFADCAARMGFKIWQILPLNPLGYGNSPYQPYSSYGGDPVYISLEILEKEGMLKDVPQFVTEHADKVDYEKVRAFKEKWFRKAYESFVPDDGYENFVKKEWVYLYSVFYMLKEKNGKKAWTEWEKNDRDWIRKSDRTLTDEETEEVEYQMFLQYIFYKQWSELKAYVNALGIKIMGDLPFYVGMDSLDVWTSPECFLLNEVYQPMFIAGVPPDYFSPTGQRWGNPIYDWEYMKKTDFDFWVHRIGYNGELYDIIRMDHFRAFDTYWKIPADCPTAIEGEWVEAPGYELFDRILKLYPQIDFVAEDLGELRPEVGVLRDHYKFNGMKVLQFFLEGDEKQWDEEDKEELIVYTGTHDNQTMKGWFLQKEEKMQKKLLEMLKKNGYEEEKVAHRFAHQAFDSKAEMVIVPVQDLLDLDDSGRINTPGTVGSPNWEWRMENMALLKSEEHVIKKMLKESKR